MRAPFPSLTWRQIYQWLFVLLLIGGLFFVTYMSKGAGSTGLEASLYGRLFLIENFNRLRMKLGDRVFTSVLIGKEGWMEYTAEKNVDDYQNALRFSPEDLRLTAERIQSCQQYAREHNMTFLLVVAPNKVSIYPDKLPSPIRSVGEESRLDQLNAYLRAHQISEALDLRPALREARQEQIIYDKWGTHWNEYGAYIAYKTIIEALSQEYPALEPYSAKFFRFRNISPSKDLRSDDALANILQAKYLRRESTWVATRDLNDIVYQMNFGDETVDYHKITWIPGSDLPTVLVFHDSFGNFGLNKFLSLNFSKAFYIHRGSSHLFLNRKNIEQFSPTILMYEVVERYLSFIAADLAGCAED